MKLDLEVLASASIKRRKPWPRIIWIGEKQESLLLLDPEGHRISVLYVPSGKTKRKIPKLAPLVQELVCVSYTNNALRTFPIANGGCLIGLLQSGLIFVWKKDEDIIKTISGLADLVHPLPGTCQLVASDDCRRILVVFGPHHQFLWQQKHASSIFNPKVVQIPGSWHQVPLPQSMEMPRETTPECVCSAIFFSSLVLGDCCQMSFVYNKMDVLCVSTALLRFNEAEHNHLNSAIFTAEWSCLEYPFQHIHNSFKPLSCLSAYVSSYARNGQVMALGANQEEPNGTRLLFVSPLTDTVLVSKLQNCGSLEPGKLGRQFWLWDIAWTSDSLFLACILRNGSVCVLPRLGEPAIIKCNGCQVNIGPAHFLPLHPLIFVSGQTELTGQQHNPMSQQMSVATHPTLPIILFSDGFTVTVVQLPVDITCFSLMKDFVLGSTKHLLQVKQQENLDMTLADAYKLPTGSKHGKPGEWKKKKSHKFRYIFEEAGEQTLNSSQCSEVSILEEDPGHFGAIQDIDAGKIVFGQPEIIQANLEDSFVGLDERRAVMPYLEAALSKLLEAWKLAVTFSDLWTSQVDDITKQAVSNLGKAFSVVLDCQSLESTLPLPGSKQVANGRLFTVISTYKTIIQLVRFDTLNQHLMPCVLRLVHKTISLMLNSKQLSSTEPRLKTLLGCYSVLKHAETCINRVYVWLATPEVKRSLPLDYQASTRFEPAILSKGEQGHSLSIDKQSQLPGKRLCSTWRLLYKCALQYQSHLNKHPDDAAQLEQVIKLLHNIQHRLQESDSDLTPRSRMQRLLSGDRFSVDGDHTQAVSAWKDHLQLDKAGKGSEEETCRLLHSILYTHIVKKELRQAVDFVDHLILQASVNRALNSQEIPTMDSPHPPLMTLVTQTMKSQDLNGEELVPCIRSKPIRQLVQSMARFMAAYFSNHTLYIYPPHSAQALPSIHLGDPGERSRIVPVYSEELSSVIRVEDLSGVWTLERTVEYLLLSGLVCETTWFANKMGDWKTAFLLSVAHYSHKQVAPHLYTKLCKPLQLPTNLSPEALLQTQLQLLLNPNRHNNLSANGEEINIPELTRTLNEILTAGVVCGVEIVPWLLGVLVDKLKQLICNLSPLVPEDFYLPAPPLYCPQPADDDMEKLPPEVELENQLRQDISSTVQVTLAVLRASNLSLPLATWYIQEVWGVQEKAAQFKATTEGPCLELPPVLKQFESQSWSLAGHKDSDRVTDVFQSFRNICTLLWLLHARDKLSLQLRSRSKHLSRKPSGSTTQDTPEKSDLQESFVALQWAIHVLAFSKFLPEEEGCVYKVVLSLLLELPASEDTADILAEHFYNPEYLHPEVQEKMERLLGEWQSVDIVPEDDGKSARPTEGNTNDGEGEEDLGTDGDVRKSVTFYQASPRSKTLSVYFQKQCDNAVRVLKKKQKCFGQYEEFVFSSAPKPNESLKSSLNGRNGLNIGCLPFETKQSYLEFLDTLFAVSFTKLLQNDGIKEHSNYPLLLPFSRQISANEFDSFFKGKGVDSSKKQKSVLMSPSSEKARAFPSESSKGKLKANMTSMASKFFQGEEALYSVDSVDDQWVLDVNFGQHYLSILHILDWLQHWACNHGNQHFKQQELSALPPSMRIRVPTQLVVLSLWLLENKYSSKRSSGRQRSPRQRVQQATDEGQGSHNGLATVEEVTEQDSFQKNSLADTGNRSLLRTQQSLTSTQREQEETEQIHTEYQKVLNGADESSSLEVSSLGSEELDGGLKQTLSIIRSSGSPGRSRKSRSARHNTGSQENGPVRGDNSTLNFTLHFNSSPERNRDTVPHTSTPVNSRSRGRSGRESNQGQDHIHQEERHEDSRNKDSRHQKSPGSPGHTSRGSEGNPGHRSKGNPGHGSMENQADVRWSNSTGVEGLAGMGLAQQLQLIVRGELRRMLEVQHQSMITMMGALDAPGMGGMPLQEGPRMSQEESLTTGELAEFQGHTKMRKESGVQGKRRKKESMRAVLSELKNLQEKSSEEPGSKRKKKSKRHKYKENTDLYDSQKYIQAQHQGGVSYIPRFMRVQPERDTDYVRFPKIPIPAWEKVEEDKRQEVVEMPLLHIDSHVQDQLFPGGSLPPPQMQLSQGGPVGLTSQQHIGVPLLRIQEPSCSHQGFGRLLPQHMVVGSEQERERKEIAKQKYAREFHQAQMKNQEELEKQRFGEQLLHINMNIPELAEKEHQKRSERQRSQVVIPTHKVREVVVQKAKPAVVKRQKPTTAVHKKVELHKEAELEGQQEKVEGQIVEEEEATEEEDVGEEQQQEDSEEEEDDGYAFRPGVFESYLALQKELGADLDTNAKIQFLTAKRLQKIRGKRKKVDFATMTKELQDREMETDVAMETESIRTAEAATSITKDTGVDPIQEALQDYRKAGAGVLPPDVYLGLKFGESTAESSSTQPAAVGRTFINVVDLDASAVLRDIPEGEEKREASAQEMTDAEVTRHLRNKIAMEEILRDSLTKVPDKPDTEPALRQDAVTIKMFETRMLGEDRLSVAVMPRSSKIDSKAAAIQRLRDMDQQMSALDRMSTRMEQDFNNTRLMLRNLEHMGDLLQPAVPESIPAGVEQPLPVSRGEAPHPTPAPKVSHKSPAVSARTTSRTGKSTSMEEQMRSEDVARLSGLTGVSEIIGEMVARGDIDVEEAGLSRTEAERLVRKGTISHVDAEKAGVTMEEIKQFGKYKPEEAVATKKGRDKEELHDWMAAKKKERLEAYKRKLADLRQHERRPFQSTQPTSTTLEPSELRAVEEERKVLRKNETEQNMAHRLVEAQHLLGNILMDKPTLPKETVSPTLARKKKRSPTRKDMSADKIRPSHDVIHGILKPSAAKRTPLREVQLTAWLEDMDESMPLREPPTPVSRKKPDVPHLKLSLEDVQEEPYFDESEEDLDEYSRAVQAMDMTGSQDVDRPAETRLEEEGKAPLGKTYKPKPYTEIVKLQRPHITRKAPPSKAALELAERRHVDSLRQSMEIPSSRRETSRQEQEMIYGSKRLPGERHAIEKSPPRVKTYTERLQEMKPRRTYTTPLVPRSTGTSVASTSSRLPVSTRYLTKPKHKPLTYVERLQQLNKGTHKTRGGEPTVIKKPVFKSHRAPHKAKTYTEQLKELQAPKRAPGAKRAHVPAVTRPMGRPRPYRDPYRQAADVDHWEAESGVSSWSMGDDVRQLLYEDETSSLGVYGVPSVMSMAGSDYFDYVMGGDYTASVNIEEIARIADAASVSSASVMSVIDWDAVENLIADVDD